MHQLYRGIEVVVAKVPYDMLHGLFLLFRVGMGLWMKSGQQSLIDA